MFDVSWSDPSRETIGQRKNRKEQSHHSSCPSRADSQDPSREGSMRSSKSRDTYAAYFKPSFLNLFGPSYKKSALKRGDLHPKFQTALPLNIPVEIPKRAHSTSSYTMDESKSQSMTLRSSDKFSSNIDSNIGSSAEFDASEGSESTFSGYTGRSEKTASTWSSVVDSARNPSLNFSTTRNEQASSLSSVQHKRSEVMTSLTNNVKVMEGLTNIVHISSAATIPIQIFESTSNSERGSPVTTLEFPIPNAGLARAMTISRPKKETEQTKRRPIPPPQAWQPPDAWESLTEARQLLHISQSKIMDIPTHLRRTDTKSTKPKTPTVEMIQLQRSIRRMEAASDRIILERLKEEWPQTADAAVYRELELEKQLWMLTALRRRLINEVQELTRPGTEHVLSLFENHASCSSLSALTFPNRIHHLSTNPLSPRSWSNVHPFSVLGPTSKLPYASDSFASIHAFSLPALLPASSIPSMLKECHRTLVSATTLLTSPSLCLAPAMPTSAISKAGVLHLTIMDPAPVPSTLGPRLRDWLDTHLILSLEKEFRCISPSRLFPEWLAKAGLRASGSTILSIQFLACCFPSKSSRIISGAIEEHDHSQTKTSQEDSTKQELKSVVGRMLWKEMWGPFVQAGNWWWEDETILEECLKMHTCWEYAIIEAVKQD